jgi:crotonobetaine/carnitine-CoA ligase
MIRPLQSVPDLLRKAAELKGSRAFLYYRGQALSYAALEQRSNRIANALREMGIERGDRVALLLPNCPEFLLAWFGILKAGAIAVPLNVQLRPPEQLRLLRHCGAKALFLSSHHAQVGELAQGACPGLRHLIYSDAKGPGPTLEELASEHEALPPPISLAPDDDACIIYTSGTTGRPKGVLLSHRTYVLTGQAFPYWLGLTEQDRLYTCLPLYHINAQAYTIMGALSIGASVVLSERFSASRFWQELASSGATQFNFIGAMLIILAKRPPGEEERLHRVRIAYGVPAFDERLRRELEARFGFRIVFGYGLTESTFGFIEPLGEPRRPMSIGKPRQHPEGRINEAKIVDEQGNELPPGRIGEILLRNPAVMKGYYRDPELTREVLRDGWLHTGDLGYRDEDGFFYFVDRKKDIIRRRGENISSQEVELVLAQHPKVLQCAVVPVPSELTDEEVKAYIVPLPGQELDPLELFKWCEERLAAFKVPRFIEIRESLPMTPTGRIAKHLLKQEREPKGPCYDREELARRPRELEGKRL